MESLANLLRSPVRLFFTLMAIYVASQSAVSGLFLAIVGASWCYHKIFGRKHAVPTPQDVVMPKPQAATVAEPEQSQTRQAPVYAKSPVVVPLKRQDAARRSA